jgi:hypothetical protein
MPVGFGADRRAVSRAFFAVALASAMLLVPARHARGQDPVPKRPLGQDIPVYVPAAGELQPREAPTIQKPTGTVSLLDAVIRGLLQNPALAAFAWETRAREARILQAGRPPNPAVSVLFVGRPGAIDRRQVRRSVGASGDRAGRSSRGCLDSARWVWPG